MASTTTTTMEEPGGIELRPLGGRSDPTSVQMQEQLDNNDKVSTRSGRKTTHRAQTDDEPVVAEAGPSAEDEALAKQVKFKLLSCCLCFFVAGLNDGSIGALLPYLISTYNISTSFVGIMYATSFAGWALAAVVMPFTVTMVGVRGALLVGAVLYAVSQVLRVWGPPYPLFAVTFFIASLAQGYQDAQANTFVSEIKASHLWLGLIHAMYSLGLLVAPPVANTIASHRPDQWALYYTVPLGIGVLNIVLVLMAFFDKEDFRSLRRLRRTAGVEAGQPTEEAAASSASAQAGQAGRLRRTLSEMRETLTVRPVWQISIFYFFYLGASFTIGSWIVLFLTDVRNLPVERAGYVPTGYYAGSFLGRLLLPHPTHTWLGGEHWMLTIYAIIILALQLISWLVNSAISTSVAISLMGFCFAPFFASGMQVSKQVIPRKVRGNALALIFVVAQLGASVFPAVTGAIASSKGVGVLQPLAVALIVLTGVAWWFVPTAPKDGSGGADQE